MNKALIICNTVFQLYTAINLRLNVLQDKEVHLVLTDRTNFQNSYKRLKELKVFDKIFLVDVNGTYKSKKKRIGLVRYATYRLKLHLAMPKFILHKVLKFDLEKYDEMYFCNHDNFAKLVSDQLYKKNSEISLFEFEDGYGTYVRPLRFEKVMSLHRIASKIFNVRLLLPENIKSSYIYEPSLYCWNDNIPKYNLQRVDCNNKEQVSIYNYVFNLEEKEYFNTKYILLEESFVTDKIENNDYEILSKVIDIVGKKDVTLKTHPRNKTNRFENKGVEVFDLPVPWEVVVLNSNIEEKVLITITSGTVFTPKILYDSKCKIILLYKLLVGYNSMFDDSTIEQFFTKTHEKYQAEMFVPESYEELEEILRKL